MSFEGLNPPDRFNRHRAYSTTQAPYDKSGHTGYTGLVQTMARNEQDPFFMSHNRLAASRRFMPQERADEIQNNIESNYQNILGRESDPGGLAYWFNRQKRGSTPDQIAQEFRDSEEYARNNPPPVAPPPVAPPAEATEAGPVIDNQPPPTLPGQQGADQGLGWMAGDEFQNYLKSLQAGDFAGLNFAKFNI